MIFLHWTLQETPGVLESLNCIKIFTCMSSIKHCFTNFQYYLYQYLSISVSNPITMNAALLQFEL